MTTLIVPGVQTGSVSEEPRADDGLRILTMRWWPRGRSRESLVLHRWERCLAPSVELLRDAIASGFSEAFWPEYAARFRAEMDAVEARLALERVRDLVASGHIATLLCSCTSAVRCHRGILRKMLRDGLA